MRRFSRFTALWATTGVVLAGIGASFAFSVYEAYRTTYPGWDRARFRLRESLAPLGTAPLVGLDWTLVDLAPPGDVPGTGGWLPTRKRAPTGEPFRESKEQIFHGGASSAFAVRIVERMETGVTYALVARAAPEGTEAPDARIYLARAIRSPADTNATIVAEAALGPFARKPAAYHDFVWTDVRYTASPEDAGRPLFAHLESSAGRPEAAVSWDGVQLFAYPPIDSERVRDARRQMIWKGGVEGVQGGSSVAFFVSPVVAQLLVLVLLVRTRHRDALPDAVWIRLLLFLGLAVAPIQELLAWALVSTEEWQGHRGPGYWRYVWTSTRALVWLPWGVVASLLVASAALVGPRWRGSRLAAGVLAARAAATATFVLPALLQRTDSTIFIDGLPFLFLVPAAATANDLLYARRLAAGAADGSTGTAVLGVLRVAWVVTLASQLVHALGTHARLAPERPSGDCFVVTAAAHGHPRFVGSWIDSGGARVNAQLETLRQLEARLRSRTPGFHRGLRAAYDRVGPLAAARISSPWRADLAYLALKPLEWVARAGRLRG